MGLRIDHSITPQKLRPRIERLFDLSAGKLLSLEKTWNFEKGAPVFTIKGKYRSRGWTEWTQGFQFGSSLLQFDATGEQRFLEIGRKNIFQRMATHVSHVGVHDHGFNNISTYGNLWRLMREGKIPFNEREMDFYELALKVSGAIQAARWTRIADGKGYIYSFNGPHSLFIDTIRSLRSLAVAHQLGHVLIGEGLATRFIMVRTAMLTIRPAAPHTRASSIRTMAVTGVPTHNRVIRPLAPGREDWPGRFLVTPNNWSLLAGSGVVRNGVVVLPFLFQRPRIHSSARLL